ncbi:MAG: hypoxanthine phosphoribosyltransferase [Ruminococcaceae bacterium]|nr:hypoxanthine phosphoribosyltransferase [Oscillospiraceae bacterium]MBO4971938.1 hypoxanthine phosphoribosyltransferase [Clostridia bacterium]MBQ1258832.1 hypoxanthine phosphoribosyltransferase [Clostridia bacterium]
MERVLVSAEQIDEITTRIAAEIDATYKDSENRLLLLCILKGSVVFMGDLMKKIKTPVEIDFMKVSSYHSGTVSSGKVNIMLDIHRKDLSELDIVIVEDIIDSGRTLSYLVNYLKLNGAASVRCCTLLDKPERRDSELKDFKADFVGCVIPDEFVIGYGLDYDEQFRALPYVGILKPSVYEK